MLDQPLATSKMIAEKDGPIGRLIFNNPARHNAVSLEMWQAVTQIMDDFEQDDGVRVSSSAAPAAGLSYPAPTSPSSKRNVPRRKQSLPMARFPRVRAGVSRIPR